MQNSDDLHQIQLYDMNSPFTVVITVSCNKLYLSCDGVEHESMHNYLANQAFPDDIKCSFDVCQPTFLGNKTYLMMMA